MRSSLNAPRRRLRWASAAIFTLSCVTGSLVASAQTAPLTLVSTAWPPFTNAPGQPRFALDLVETALGRIGITAKTTIVSAAQFTPSLLAGQFDGSAAAWKDPEREKVLIFSQPYLENRLVLVGRHGVDVSAKTLADLKGKRVAIVEGYSYGEAIDSTGTVFVRSRSEEDSVERLLKGGVDYTLMDELVVQYIVSNYPKESGTRLQIGSTPLLTRELYLAVRRTRPDAESIVDRFNAQLRTMIADHTYHRLLHVNWIRADVDGDGLVEYVPLSDRQGPVEPQRAYTLFSTTKPAISTTQPTPQPRGETGRRYYFGGTIYPDWASVPNTYKVFDPQRPDLGRSTASIFTFKW
jgi:polar amino acid transport system substrate-binding protein